MKYGKDTISSAEWKTLCAHPTFTTNWDNATQTGSLAIHGDYYQTRLKKLSAFAEKQQLKDFDAIQWVKFLNAYHTHIIGFLPSERTGRISTPQLQKSELRELYSLIYHLLPEDGTHTLHGGGKNAWRSHIKQFFETLQLGEILNEAQSAANLQKLAAQGAQYTKKRHGGIT